MKKIILILSMFIITIVYIVHPYIYEPRCEYEEINDKLIRFHVIANSDSPEDQNLKLKIRDKILEEMGDKFAQSTSIENSRQIIEHNIDKIENLAKDEINKNGKNYDVVATLCQDKFPTKSYGDLTLPAGEYEALKVIIGEGKGKNWWCVMFPPLCFVDITHSKTTTNVNNVNYDLNNGKKNGKQQIVLKSKVVELFEKTKIKFAKMK
ncbi:stage II sporulation protein R [Anaerosalibacter sp. Marseille-P3206]|uniref:stage II sporulation protein R n=1 Tax=Anaerosalibacter sp. Marseille-P3206 TaxID=1871005 RepID=UPI000984A937|nr:stage II sporulation protein R [Anaerosalibacter sp. Marseille-P3206]